MSSKTKPILFNTDMVKAIMEGRKTQTRRVNKDKELRGMLNSPFRKENPDITDKQIIEKLSIPQYDTDDILYIRECWSIDPSGEFIFKADYTEPTTGEKDIDYLGNKVLWKPSIHMPKEAARIFLKVTGVRAERLQEITVDGVEQEGIKLTFPLKKLEESEHLQKFICLWDSTVKESDIEKYGWTANPWVWVYEFERIDKCERT